jgi:hypothetical protein
VVATAVSRYWEGVGVSARMLLSFERPAPRRRAPVVQGARAGVGAPPRTLKTAQLANKRVSPPVFVSFGERVRRDHRQDKKGTRWMPWHQESKKGVDGCEKPRGDAEQSVIRGFPNGETQRR